MRIEQSLRTCTSFVCLAVNEKFRLRPSIAIPSTLLPLKKPSNTETGWAQSVWENAEMKNKLKVSYKPCSFGGKWRIDRSNKMMRGKTERREIHSISLVFLLLYLFPRKLNKKKIAFVSVWFFSSKNLFWLNIFCIIGFFFFFKVYNWFLIIVSLRKMIVRTKKKF